MTMEAIYRRYRPSTFADVSDQEHVKTTLRNQLATGNLAHAYLFTGPRGVGKTTVARLLAKAVNCLQPISSANHGETPPPPLVGSRHGSQAGPMAAASDNLQPEPCNVCEACKDIMSGTALDIHEIDAASQTDVDNVREHIIKSVRFAPNRLKYKVYIIDEVHMLSPASFNALLKTLEEPPAHALFVLATTEIHKVPATIISRCQRFDFHRIPVDAMMKRLGAIATQEGVEVDEDVLRDIARHAEGSERDAESLLGQVFALGEKRVTRAIASLVLPTTGKVLIGDFLETLLRRDTASAVRLVNAYLEQGVDLAHFNEAVIEALRGFLFTRLGGEAAAPDFDPALGRRLAASCASNTDLTQAIRALLEARRGMKTDKIPQLGLELAIVEFCLPAQSAEPRNSSPARATPTLLSTSPSPPLIAIPAADLVFDTIPVVNLDEIKRKWPEVFNQLKDMNASLPLVVQAGEITGADGDALEFTFQYALHAEVVNQEKNRRIIEAALEKVLGKRLRVRAHYKKAEAEADVVVSDLLQAFGGNAT